MSFSKEIKELRQHCLLSQEAFAKEIGVSFATVNRWETGKTQPKYKALRQITDYCKKNKLEFDVAIATATGGING